MNEPVNESGTEFNNDALSNLTPVESNEQPAPEFADRLRRRVQAIEARAERTRADRWHLAQLNLGVFKAPLDSAEMQPFAEALDRINAIAEDSPGFIWRLTDEDGGSSSNVDVPGATDPLLASNLSVWTSLESLWDFMYRTDHASYLRRRTEWFQLDDEAMTVAWWIPAGTLPTLADAVQRLDHLRHHGPSDRGFPLGRRIPQPPTTQEPNMSAESTDSTTGLSTVIPYLTVGDSRAALAFYAEVFGAQARGQVFEMDDGSIGHAEMVIDGQVFYMADQFPSMGLRSPVEVGSNSVSLVLVVDDCDAVYEHALAAGATGERPPTNQHGFRSAWIVDPWGHRWSPTSAVKSGA